MMEILVLGIFWLLGCGSAQVQVKKYAALEVDSYAVSLESLTAANSISECLFYCTINLACSVVEFEWSSRACTSVERESISWQTPSRRVFVDMETPSKIKYFHQLTISSHTHKRHS